MPVNPKSTLAKVCIVICEQDSFSDWSEEVLRSSGLLADYYSSVPYDRLTEYHALVLIGSGLNANERAIQEWLEGPNRLLFCSGSTWGVEGVLGLERGGKQVSGRLQMAKSSHKIWPENTRKAVCFGATLCKKLDDAHPIVLFENGFAAITECNRAYYFAPSLGRTLAYIKQGLPCISPAAGDSHGEVEELDPATTEACTRLDWDNDRANGYFDEPYADVLQSLWFRTFFYAAHRLGLNLAVAWPYPDAAPLAAVVSGEISSGQPDGVYALQSVLAYSRTPASLLSSPTALGSQIFRQLKHDDTDVGLLFSVEATNCVEKTKIQAVGLTRMASQPNLFCARPMGGQWLGFTEPYEAVKAIGAKVVSSKGGRQAATAGFPFGTAFPYFVRRFDGSLMGLLEVPYHFYNLDGVAEERISHVLSKVRQHHGVLHLAIDCDTLTDATRVAGLRRFVGLVREERAHFFSLEQLGPWLDGVRNLAIRHSSDGGLLMTAGLSMRHFTVLILGEVPAESANQVGARREVTVYGAPFTALVIDLPALRTVELSLDARLAA